MNILILGSGGREHTFAWKIAQSPKCKALFVAPGNSGTEKIATNMDIGVTDFDAIKELVIDKKINMVVVGPEDPLVQGVHDYFLNDDAIKHVSVIGPQKAAAQFEGHVSLWHHESAAHETAIGRGSHNRLVPAQATPPEWLLNL